MSFVSGGGSGLTNADVKCLNIVFFMKDIFLHDFLL